MARPVEYTATWKTVTAVADAAYHSWYCVE